MAGNSAEPPDVRHVIRIWQLGPRIGRPVNSDRIHNGNGESLSQTGSMRQCHLARLYRYSPHDG